MKRVTYAVSYPPELAHPVHRQIADGGPASRVELVSWGPTASVTSLLWCDGDRAAMEAVLDGVDSVTTASLVAGDGGTYAFVRQTSYEFADALMELLGAANVAFLPPVTFLDTGAARFEAVGESRFLSAFHERLSDLVDARIVRVREFRREETTALTDRQRAALSAAVDAGYYEVPRTGSVDDVADELDCARATAGELLRKAEARAVREFLDEI
ncbi:helix-turn-helix domain-containing protein [Halorarius halobius]|uniref:helix-turn-helix domain-containing protein n=1 Tax=Halorarius halobius TaxID=2962671 RepID=UPI0020CED2B7|nr:helix-turn-helix domain-containing protein [Halorarius halobius]